MNDFHGSRLEPSERLAKKWGGPRGEWAGRRPRLHRTFFPPSLPPSLPAVLYQEYSDVASARELRRQQREEEGPADEAEGAEEGPGPPRTNLSPSSSFRAQRSARGSTFSLWQDIPDVRGSGVLDTLSLRDCKLQEVGAGTALRGRGHRGVGGRRRYGYARGGARGGATEGAGPIGLQAAEGESRDRPREAWPPGSGRVKVFRRFTGWSRGRGHKMVRANRTAGCRRWGPGPPTRGVATWSRRENAFWRGVGVEPGAGPIGLQGIGTDTRGVATWAWAGKRKSGMQEAGPQERRGQ